MLDYIRYSLPVVKWRGRLDGSPRKWFLGFIPIPKPPYPSEEQELSSDFEQGIKGYIGKMVEKITEKWRKLDARLRSTCDDLLENRISKIKKALPLIEAQFNKARDKFEARQEEFLDCLKPSLRPPLSWLFFLSLFLGEFYFNII
jgi:hypothetical protein